VAINPDKHKATIVGIPRDSYVEIPVTARTRSTPPVLRRPRPVVKTVEQLTGLTMDYWALTGFQTFQQMVNGIDGLVVDVPFAMNDSDSGASSTRGPASGRSRGARVRAQPPRSSVGDFGRSENQGLLCLRAAPDEEGVQQGPEQHAHLGRILHEAGDHGRCPLDEVMDLAFTGTTINPEKVVNVVVTGGVGMVGTMSVVNLDQAEVDRIADDLKDDGILKEPTSRPRPTPSCSAASGPSGSPRRPRTPRRTRPAPTAAAPRSARGT
jgi:hypothetical protein